MIRRTHHHALLRYAALVIVALGAYLAGLVVATPDEAATGSYRHVTTQYRMPICREHTDRGPRSQLASAPIGDTAAERGGSFSVNHRSAAHADRSHISTAELAPYTMHCKNIWHKGPSIRKVQLERGGRYAGGSDGFNRQGVAAVPGGLITKPPPVREGSFRAAEHAPSARRRSSEV